MDEKRSVLVTGAGRGIGRAAALEMDRRGWRVVACARSQQTIESLCQSLHDATAIALDVTDPVAVERAVAQVIEIHGRLDAVINAAGAARLCPVELTDEALWREMIDTNLSGTFYVCRSAWKHLAVSGGGIVNISSEAARDPLVGFAAYAAAKGGVNALSLELAREGQPAGIRVHVVGPGAVETTMLRGLVSEQVWGRDKTLDPADVASVIADCLTTPLRHASGEVIYLNRT